MTLQQLNIVLNVSHSSIVVVIEQRKVVILRAKSHDQIPSWAKEVGGKEAP